MIVNSNIAHLASFNHNTNASQTDNRQDNSHQCRQQSNNNRNNKAITKMVIRLLDDRTYCAQFAITHFGALTKNKHV